MAWWNKADKVEMSDSKVQTPAQAPPYSLATDSRLKLLWTDEQGKKYYGLVDNRLMPATRYLPGLRSVEFAEMGFTAEDAVAYLEGAIAAQNAGNYSDASYKMISMRNRILTTNPEEAWLQLAAVYCVVEGETLETFSGARQLEKVKAFNSNAQMRAFFLSMGYTVGRLLLKSSKEGIHPVSLTMLTPLLHALQATQAKSQPNYSTT